MKKLQQLALTMATGLALLGTTLLPTTAHAAEKATSGMSVSPMSSKIVLAPGEEYVGTIKVYNSSNDDSELNYRVFAESFFVDDDYSVTLGTSNDYNAMKDWIVIGAGQTGTIPAGDYAEVSYTISVPENAPAGGQYASIVAASVPAENKGGSVGIQEVWQIASTIYASISGTSTLAGTIGNNSVPSLVFTAPLSASSSVENTGNVHTAVTSYLQVYPIFSDEEVYTNEENPTSLLVLPGTTRYVTNTWEGTPTIGLFRVVQTVEAFGKTSVTEKIVLICPLAVIVLIGALLAACIFWLVSRAIRRKK